MLSGITLLRLQLQAEVIEDRAWHDALHQGAHGGDDDINPPLMQAGQGSEPLRLDFLMR